MAESYPVLTAAFRTGPFEQLGGWAHAIPQEARDEIRALLREQWKVQFLDDNFPCDGGCNPNSGPEEECSRDGRSPRDLWEIIGRLSQDAGPA